MPSIRSSPRRNDWRLGPGWGVLYRWAVLCCRRVLACPLRMARQTRKATLIRKESSDQGTFGLFTLDSGFQCYSGEPPECIPEGVYLCRKGHSPKRNKDVYWLLGVPGYKAIQIHSGNFCGDVDKGLKSDSEGCVLLGNAIGELAGQKALLGSRDAVKRFEDDLEGEDLQLTVQWAK